MQTTWPVAIVRFALLVVMLCVHPVHCACTCVAVANNNRNAIALIVNCMFLIDNLMVIKWGKFLIILLIDFD